MLAPIITAILMFLQIILCREYYRMYTQHDKLLTSHNRLLRDLEILDEYLDYYITATKSGVTNPLTLQEYKRINKL